MATPIIGRSLIITVWACYCWRSVSGTRCQTSSQVRASRDSPTMSSGSVLWRDGCRSQSRPWVRCTLVQRGRAWRAASYRPIQRTRMSRIAMLLFIMLSRGWWLIVLVCAKSKSRAIRKSSIELKVRSIRQMICTIESESFGNHVLELGFDIFK